MLSKKHENVLDKIIVEMTSKNKLITRSSLQNYVMTLASYRDIRVGKLTNQSISEYCEKHKII